MNGNIYVTNGCNIISKNRDKYTQKHVNEHEKHLRDEISKLTFKKFEDSPINISAVKNKFLSKNGKLFYIMGKII
jgi:hypothetical protein